MKSTQYLFDIKTTILISVFIHALVFLTMSFHRPVYIKKKRWSIEPIDLVSMPTAKAKEKTVETKKEEKKVIISTPKKVEKKIVTKEKEEKTEEKKEKVVPPKEETLNNEAPAPASGVISVEDKEFPFSYYLEFIQNKINRAWSFPLNITEDKEVIVFFEISKNGEVKNINLEKTSDIFPLDQSALRAVLVSVPFPPLPQEYKKESLNVHFKFQLKLQKGIN